MVTRTHKFAGSVVSLAVDGENYLNTFFVERADLYPNQFITVSSYGQYTKHYFAHDRRVSSRVGGALNYNDGRTRTDEPWTTTLPSGRNWYDRSVAMKLQLSRAFECTDMTQERLELTTEWGVQQLMAPKEEGEIFYYHQNHQGSPSFISTTSGFLTEHMLLLAYGEVFASNQNAASWQNPYSFTGKEQDQESGLHYFGARYYLAEIGLWLSTDPLADYFSNLSPYAYAANNPALFTDRWGLAPNPPAWWHEFQTRFHHAFSGAYIPASTFESSALQNDVSFLGFSNLVINVTPESSSTGATFDIQSLIEIANLTLLGTGSLNDIVRLDAVLNNNHTYRYAQRINGETVSAVQLSINHQKNITKTLNSTKAISSKLGVVGGLVMVGDVLYNSEIKASHGLNAAMTGLAFTGWGAPIAGAWFIADFGSEIFTGKSLSERLDSNVGSPLVNW